MSRIVFADANLVDGDRPARRASVVVAGEHIEAVSEARIAARSDDRVIELAGRTLMPGMILGHYHATYKDVGTVPMPVGLEAPPGLHAARAVRNLSRTLRSGFTGVISAGSPYAIDASMKQAIAEGTIEGPRMVACGHDVGTTGHSNDTSFPWHWEIGAMGNIRRCDGADAFRRGVRLEVKEGAEIIKLFVTGGHGTAGPRERMEMSRDELAAAIDSAHERGALVRGHIANRDAILLALDLGMDIIDHGDGLDDACIDRLVETGAALAPSLLFPKAFMALMAGQPFVASMQAEFDRMAAILPRANAAGVRLILGDDYGAVGLDHGRYAEELALYVEDAGIPALDVIRWATKNGAAAMGRGDELGTLEAGKLADLIVVDGNPLDDITILQQDTHLLGVMKGGVFVFERLS